MKHIAFHCAIVYKKASIYKRITAQGSIDVRQYVVINHKTKRIMQNHYFAGIIIIIIFIFQE